jgi:hypothetical protein
VFFGFWRSNAQIVALACRLPDGFPRRARHSSHIGADVVPLAYAEGPQSIWSLETAFLLRSIENVVAAAGTIVLALIGAQLITRSRRPSTRQPE